jgi:small subunit ribosomal protein S17
MTAEETNDEVKETPAEDSPQSSDVTPPAEGTGSPQDEGSDAPAEEPVAAAEEESAPVEEAEPEEVLSPKERRGRARSAHSGEARPRRSVEERTAERVERRRKKAEERRRWRAGSREKRRAAGPREGTPRNEEESTGSPRIRQGVVVSDKADKTITVRIDVARQHRIYGKIVRTSSNLHAHDESNEANAGDTVSVVESRPLSRSKRWRLVEVLERAR